jgi:hypothetical protein
MRPLILTASACCRLDLLLCLKHFFFGLEPVVDFRARLITSLDVEFVGSSPDSFFERKRLDQGFLCTRRHWHGTTSGSNKHLTGFALEGSAQLQPSLASFARRFSALNGVQLSVPDPDILPEVWRFS